MHEINQYIGKQIRMYRKVQGLTLQQLADMIHKSRATMSKYETGEITLDVETLYDISSALRINMHQLTDYKPAVQTNLPVKPAVSTIHSPFLRLTACIFTFMMDATND